eukprot:GILI01031525.1.p1 GENE.GILI01031525.1~~GILI01031525.1.p1  ORF type:complete len:440 (-),score=103.59 GILI01031525.1:114-1328(-)
MLRRIKRESGVEDELREIPAEIDTLIILDRQSDLVTPLCTQLTYEGLIEEVFGIQHTYVDVDAELITSNSSNTTATAGKKIKVPLNSNDKLYSEIRDLNFSVLGPLLHQRAAMVQEVYKQKDKLTTVGEINEYMKKFKVIQHEHTALGIHINLAQKISSITQEALFHKRLECEHGIMSDAEAMMDFIEELIDRQEPLVRVLRLLCLYSVVNGGIKPKPLEFFKREILQTYGFELLFTLNNLERSGLFKKQETKFNWNSVKKAWRLIVEDVDVQNPSDISYVFSGYAPLSVRMIEAALKPNGWREKEEALRLVPGPAIEFTQDKNATLPLPTAGDTGESRKQVVVVCFVGGVTHAELSAIRHLAKQEEGRREYIVVATKIINGSSLLRTMMEDVENLLDPSTLKR